MDTAGIENALVAAGLDEASRREWKVNYASAPARPAPAKPPSPAASPPREDLINAVFADRMDGYAAITEALADPDPWHAFTRYLEAVCATQAALYRAMTRFGRPVANEP